MDTPHPRTYWVQAAKFLAGSYPGSSDLNLLIAAGIRCFIDLTSDREVASAEKYAPVLQRISKKSGIRLSYHHFPVDDFDTSSHEMMQAILECIDRSLNEENAPVYVHCRLGLGRTGMVVGCWLIQNRFATAETVLSLISELRKNEPTGHLRSPQSFSQIAFVKNWKPR